LLVSSQSEGFAEGKQYKVNTELPAVQSLVNLCLKVLEAQVSDDEFD